jgi:hypothetical protein
MSSNMPQINHRLLSTFDSTDPTFVQNRSIHPGIKIASQMCSLSRFVHSLFGWTIELQIGNNYYVVGRKSLEKMLLRHREEAGLEQRQNLSWDELVQGTKHFFESERIHNAIEEEKRHFVSNNSPNDRMLNSFLTDMTTPSQEIKIWDGFSHFVNVSRVLTPPPLRDRLRQHNRPQPTPAVTSPVVQNQPQQPEAHNVENHDFIFDRIHGLERTPKGEKLLDLFRAVQQLDIDCSSPSSSIALVKNDGKQLVQKLAFAIYCAHDPARFGLTEVNLFEQHVGGILANFSKFSLIECLQLHDVITSENCLPLSMLSENRNKKLGEENKAKNAPVKEASLQRLKAHYQEYLHSNDQRKATECQNLMVYINKEIENCQTAENEQGKNFFEEVKRSLTA